MLHSSPFPLQAQGWATQPGILWGFVMDSGECAAYLNLREL